MTAVAPLPGNAERQQRHHVPADRRRGCDLRRDDPFGNAAAELLAALAVLPFDAVRDERCDRRTGARHDAADHADERRARERAAQLPRLARCSGIRVAIRPLPATRRRREALAEAHEHFAEPVGADHHRQVADAVAQDVAAEREAVHAVDLVDADRRHEHAEEQADERVGERSAAECHDAGEAEQHDREVLGRIERQRDLRERHGERDHHRCRDEPARQCREERPAERLAPDRRRAPSNSRPTAAAHPWARRGCGTGST